MNIFKTIAKVFVVTVTYGDRWHLLEQMLRSFLMLNVGKIIIVDNGSNKSSVVAMDKIESELIEKLKVIHLAKNMGPAFGFTIGINEAISDPECEFIWLMDDDLIPKSNALKELLSVWNEISTPDQENMVALASNRIASYGYQKAVFYNQPSYMLGSTNSFWGFNCIELFSKIKEKVFGRRQIKKKYGEVLVYPYGGLFFNKKLIDTISLPDKRYGLYVDDYEFTHRISRCGGKIFLVIESSIDDIESTWENGGNEPHFVKIAKSNSPVRLYYTTRNMLYFLKGYYCTSCFVFSLNVLVYSIVFALTSLLFGKINNVTVYLQAVNDGFRGKLGINSRFALFSDKEV